MNHMWILLFSEKMKAILYLIPIFEIVIMK